MTFHRLCLPFWACLLLLPDSAWGQSYTPDHPKVQAMVQRAVKFLSSIPEAGGQDEYGAGETILVGYTILKASGDTSHPKVQLALTAATRLIESLGGRPAQGESKIVYEASVAVIFLASYDAGMYRPQLIKALDWLQTVQKPHGGFGYLGRPTGDTSQVQYAVLAMWTLQQAGLEVPVSMVESTIRYLKSTLDPSGGWGYQGKVSSGGLIQQESVTKSLATAGIGALVIAGDILRFYGERKKKVDDEDGVPSAFVRTDLRQKVREERKGGTMRRGDIEGALALARRFQNTSDFSGTNWYYYWRYSQERYESFAEIMENQQQSSPTWYNRGVEHLAGLQAPNGSWGGPTSAGRDVTTVPVSTSFAVLFLVRSTQTAIGKLDEGVTFGGYGLPNDVTAVKLVGDRIVGDAETSVENLLLMLEADEAGDVQIGLLPEDLQLASDPAQRREQVARLARLLASGDYAARRIAAKLLGRSEDLARVPDLIYALSDEDPYVPGIAEEGLRLLSRKLQAGDLGVQPTAEQRRRAEEFWKAWYRGLRPEYIFIDR